jgi:hypothetical protein
VAVVPTPPSAQFMTIPATILDPSALHGFGGLIAQLGDQPTGTREMLLIKG